MTLSAPGLVSRTVAVTVTDDDTQDITLSTVNLNVGEAGSGTFTVRLAFQPSANVTVSVSSANSAKATATPATLTFTPANYATPQTVTVGGVNDGDVNNESVDVTLSAPGLVSRTVAVTVIDDDI